MNIPKSRYNLQQPKVVFENCTFENNDNIGDWASNYAAFWAAANATIKFKNCTAKDNVVGFAPVANSKFLYEGTTTYTDVDIQRSVTFGGTNYDVRTLDLTVLDFDENPIENATVTVKQAENREEWTFFTDEEGKIYDCHADLPVFVKSEEVLEGSLFYADPWSNNIEEGRYHLITIMKEGYQIWQRKVEFIDDLVVTASLRNVSAPGSITGDN